VCTSFKPNSRASFILDLYYVINEHIVALSVPLTIAFIVFNCWMFAHCKIFSSLQTVADPGGSPAMALSGLSMGLGLPLAGKEFCMG